MIVDWHDEILPGRTLCGCHGETLPASYWLHKHMKRLLVAAPFLWLILLFLVPFGIVLKIALSDAAIAGAGL